MWGGQAMGRTSIIILCWLALASKLNAYIFHAQCISSCSTSVRARSDRIEARAHGRLGDWTRRWFPLHAPSQDTLKSVFVTTLSWCSVRKWNIKKADQGQRLTCENIRKCGMDRHEEITYKMGQWDHNDVQQRPLASFVGNGAPLTPNNRMLRILFSLRRFLNVIPFSKAAYLHNHIIRCCSSYNLQRA